MPKVPQATKGSTLKHKFTINYAKPAADGIFDGAEFEKFLHDRIKVEGKAGMLGDRVKIVRDNSASILTLTSSIHMSKRYLKYLTKKYLKKHGTREWMRVIATSKDGYVLKYNMVANEEEEEE